MFCVGYVWKTEHCNEGLSHIWENMVFFGKYMVWSIQFSSKI